nr:PEP-CTERM sorting domain-containing protein [uncultured Desulfobacter sp.]
MKKIIIAMGVLLVFASLTPFANALEIITFDTFSNGASYTEDGFTLTADDGSEFWAIAPEDASDGYYYTGSVALVNELSTTTTLVADGSFFNLISIDLAEAFSQEAIYEASISFIATYADGSTYSVDLTTDGSEGLQTFDFGSEMTNLASVSFGNGQSFQFDNIVVNTVPVPSSLLLLAAGMGVLAGTKRKRA